MKNQRKKNRFFATEKIIVSALNKLNWNHAFLTDTKSTFRDLFLPSHGKAVDPLTQLSRILLKIHSGHRKGD